MVTSKKVRFSQSGQFTAPERVNTRAGKRLSNSHARLEAPFHAKSIGPLNSGAGAKLSFSRSPASPPTPHPRFIKRTNSMTNTRKMKQHKPNATTQEITLSLPLPSPDSGRESKRSSTSSASITKLQVVPPAVVQRQATQRQRALDTYARKRFEPILRRLTKAQAETEKQLATLQGLFADVAKGGTVTLFGVPHGKAPNEYAPSTKTKQNRHMNEKEKGAESYSAAYPLNVSLRKPSAIQRRRNQKLLRTRKRVTKDSAGLVAPRGYIFRGFLCCQCQSTNGKTILCCHVCQHGYDSYGCRCLDIYS